VLRVFLKQCKRWVWQLGTALSLVEKACTSHEQLGHTNRYWITKLSDLVLRKRFPLALSSVCNWQNVDYSFVAFQSHEAVAGIDVNSVSGLIVSRCLFSDIDTALLRDQLFGLSIPAEGEVVVFVRSHEEMIGL
jgi:hypothetical protein